MAPIEVIDLLSSSDEDDKSPSKLLKSFNVRTNTSTAETTEQKRANGAIGVEGSKSRFGHGNLGAQNGLSHNQSQMHVSPNVFKTRTLPAFPQTSTALPQAESTRQSFTTPVLSKETWNALGTPGRKLQQDLTRIQRNLDTSRRQSEPQRIARVDKAERYQRQRRLSGGISQPRPTTVRNDMTEPASTSSMRGATEPSASAQEVLKLPQSPKVSATGSVDGANSFARGQVSGIKRSWENSQDSARVKRHRPEPQHLSANTHHPKAPLLDVTDVTVERFSDSSEHESEKPAPPAAVKEHLNLDGSSPFSSSPTAQANRARWTSEEDALVKTLKEIDELDWDEIVTRLPGRSKGSIKVRYYTHLKNQEASAGVEALATGPPLQQPTGPKSWTAPSAQRQHLNVAGEHRPQVSSILEIQPMPETLTVSIAGIKKSSDQYTAADNALLKTLKEVKNLKWAEIHAYFPARSLGSLQVHYSAKVKAARLDLSRIIVPSQAPASGVNTIQTEANQANPALRSVGNFGSQYTAEEVALLKRLKEEEQLDWKAMVPYFNGRTAGSLQVYWYTKIRQGGPARKAPNLHRSDSQDHVRSKRSRKSNVAATDGFVSWADARSLIRDGANTDEGEDTASDATTTGPLVHQDNVFPRSVSRILRQRELGSGAGVRAWTSSRCTLPEELKNNVYKDYSLQQYYHGTSGDVVGLSWSSTGKKFAAGSIAITDNQSMQYNMSRNLLVGDYEHNQLQELVEHHVPRPLVDEADNPNALGAMRHTQDKRLFLTVSATGFSPLPSQENCFYTAGTDRMLRKYLVGTNIQHTVVEHAAKHAASVDLLAMHQEGLVATGCHSASDSINVFRCSSTSLENVWTGSPRRQDLQTTASIFPSSLKWGEAYVHRNFLLAGFSGDSTSSAEDKRLAGETALWDMEHQKQLEMKGTIRNVFDVCWNARPSSTSVVFAVASNATGMNFSRGMRTAVSCFAPGQPLSAVVRWQCPALDINDVLICPYNDHLVAAGATDGKVYVWDQRWAAAGQSPLHVLSHGESLNVLPHGYDRELTDTGVRFLTWGTTSSRLYSGSSDGVVKVWNPYRSADNAHVEDIDVYRQHRSAIMSGAFSPDHRKLLVGTENGRINVFKIGGPTGKAQQYKLHTAADPKVNPEHSFEASNALIQSGAITFRPCGAMPLMQAVQGEFYQGPFQAPTSLEYTNAENKLQQALTAQNDLAAKRAQEGQIDPWDPALDKTQVRVRDAQAAIEDLEDRADFAEQSKPRAEAFQQSLMQARKAREDLLGLARDRFRNDDGPCEHDCAYLPTSEELEDGGRSELRIPGVLRTFGSAGRMLSRLQDDDQFSERCSKCFPMRARPRGSKRELCFNCKLEGLRLTTSCSVCSAPARIETDESKRALCEACAFACFRCAGPVKLLGCSASLVCNSCKLTWNPGVLGYELVTEPEVKKAVTNSMPLYEQYDDVGSAERERLANYWNVD